MGQFHTDFSMGQDKGTIPVANNSIFLGKKTYCCNVQYIKDGKDCNGFHTRSKGISIDALKNQVKVEGLKDEYDMYDKVFNGNKYEIQMVYKGGRPKFKSEDDCIIKSLTKFPRTLDYSHVEEKDKIIIRK